MREYRNYYIGNSLKILECFPVKKPLHHRKMWKAAFFVMPAESMTMSGWNGY